MSESTLSNADLTRKVRTLEVLLHERAHPNPDFDAAGEALYSAMNTYTGDYHDSYSRGGGTKLRKTRILRGDRRQQMRQARGFDEYQEATKKTAVYPEDRDLEYLSLGLASEAGEAAGVVKKIIRDHGNVPTQQALADLATELGDVLWYVAQLADVIGLPLRWVAEMNINKLEDRKQRGKLRGSGDHR